MAERRWTSWWVAALVGIFALLALPWFLRAWTALPVDDAPEDAWLIVWVLEWGRHALATAPSQLFDPPVNWPAPRQLAGSEHFLASQLAYAPLRWLTGSAVAAANLTAWLSYALAAVAMQALCVRLGVAPGAAFVVAVAYGFGWHGTAGRMHILQSQHLWLPVIALALDRLRERANAGRAAVVAFVVAAALLSSFHMAVYAGVATAIWGTAELVRRDAGRGRYLVAAGLAGAVAVAVLVVVSLPYLQRPEARGEIDLVFSRWKTSHLAPQADDFLHADPFMVARTYLGCALGGGQRLACVPIDWLAERIWALVRAGALPPYTLVLPLLLLAGVARAALGKRPLVWIGLSFVLAGLLLYGPESVDVGGMRIPFPRTFVAASPARFIRESQRALVLSFFGAGLIAACGLDAVLALCARPLRPLLVAALALAAAIRVPATSASTAMSPTDLIARWGRLAPVRWLDNPAVGPDADSYRELAAVVQAAPGPLLDLPDTADGAGVFGQTIHGQPSIDFYTGYLPPHVSMVQALIAALPDADALDDLIGMTGLRWVVLRPAAEWPDAGSFERARAAFGAHPRTVAVRPVGTFTLVELDPRSRHPEWFRSLAAGPRHGFSALGTPLEPVPADARLAVAVDAPVRAGATVTVRLSLANTGAHGWPAAVPARPDAPLTVRLELTWSTSSNVVEVHTLRRDVPPGETLEQRVVTTVPDHAGRAVLSVRLTQVGGSELASSRTDVDVLPAAGAQ